MKEKDAVVGVIAMGVSIGVTVGVTVGVGSLKDSSDGGLVGSTSVGDFKLKVHDK